MDHNSITVKRDAPAQWGDRFTLYQGSRKIAEYVLGYYYKHHVIQIRTRRFYVYSLIALDADFHQDVTDLHLANHIQQLDGGEVTDYTAGIIHASPQTTGTAFFIDQMLLGYVATCPLPDAFSFQLKASDQGLPQNLYYIQLLFACPSSEEPSVSLRLATLYADYRHCVDRISRKEPSCQDITAQQPTS